MANERASKRGEEKSERENDDGTSEHRWSAPVVQTSGGDESTMNDVQRVSV